LITARDEPSRLSSQGYRSRTTACPRARNWALRFQPRLKRIDSNLAPRVLCSRASPWAMPAHAVGETLDARAEPTWPPPRPFRSIAANVTLCCQRYCGRPISGALSGLGPNVDGVAGRIQRSELLPSRDALLRA